MKKQIKKLVLAKETMRNLSAMDLVEAVGATNGCSTQTSGSQTTVAGSERFCLPSGADIC